MSKAVEVLMIEAVDDGGPPVAVMTGVVRSDSEGVLL